MVPFHETLTDSTFNKATSLHLFFPMINKPDYPIHQQDALLIVDVQKDFLPHGRVEVERGHFIIPVLNRWLHTAEQNLAWIYLSRDWHPENHPSFLEESGSWPSHCIQDSDGAQFADDLYVPDEAIIISKGVRFDRDQLSAFDETGLADKLFRDGVKRLFVGGLALDVCVRATVLDAIKEGLDVHLITTGTEPVEPERRIEVLQNLEAAGAKLEMLQA